jgi:hypothetical protein
MARLQSAAKAQSRVSPKVLVRSIVTLLFMSCILNILYLTRLQAEESEHDAWGVVGVRQLQTSIGAAKNPPEPPSSASRDVTVTEKYFPPGKELVLALLREAGITKLDNATVAALPTWNEISQLYGSQSPIVYGLDTCASYREMVPAHERHAAVAGMFNTGTNAIAWSLRRNINTSRPNLWQVRMALYEYMSRATCHSHTQVVEYCSHFLRCIRFPGANIG